MPYQERPPIPPHPYTQQQQIYEMYDQSIPNPQFGAPYLTSQQIPISRHHQYGPSSTYQEPQYNTSLDPFDSGHHGQYSYQRQSISPPPHQQYQSGQHTINPGQYYGSNKSESSL